MSSCTLSMTPLAWLLDAYGEEETSAHLNNYCCVRDSATESFLHRKAIEMEKRDLSRTYVAIDDRDLDILGYVTLGIKCLSVPEENLLSKKTLKSMNVEPTTKVAQSYLLGQLSRSENAPKGLGNMLLDFAFDRLGLAKTIVGCRMVRLDCHDELIPYYERYGFEMIRKNDSGELNQMMAFVLPRSDSVTSSETQNSHTVV